MAIDLQKINVKFYLAGDAVLSPEDAFRIFSQWIPETKDEVLIDVADYQHVPQGPKTVLVGHEANYTLDNTDGRYGLLYGQKATAQGSNAELLRDTRYQRLLSLGQHSSISPAIDVTRRSIISREAASSASVPAWNSATSGKPSWSKSLKR